MTNDYDESKLPRWAQRRLKALRCQIAEHEQKLTQGIGAPGTREDLVTVGSHGMGLVKLRSDEHFNVRLGPRHEDTITVVPRRDGVANRPCLYVYAHGTRIQIQPTSANTVEISLAPID